MNIFSGLETINLKLILIIFTCLRLPIYFQRTTFLSSQQAHKCGTNVNYLILFLHFIPFLPYHEDCYKISLGMSLFISATLKTMDLKQICQFGIFLHVTSSQPKAWVSYFMVLVSRLFLICVPSLVEFSSGVPELCWNICTNSHIYPYNSLLLEVS